MAEERIHSVAVLGAGQMGGGIAQTLASFGYSVWLYDVASAQLEKAKSQMQKSLQKLSDKGKLSEEPDKILKQVQFVSSLSELKTTHIAIEAIVEKKEIKKDLFKKLDEVLPPSAVIASNTSSISITELGAATQRPSQFIGIHFMNPVHLMKLVEVITGELTSSETLAKTKSLVESLQKKAVESRDYPGFIVNRILMPMINEAVYSYYEGLGSKEDIDQAMKLGTNHPMGPFELADFIGLDTCLSIMEVLYEGFGDSKYRPCPLLRNYVAAGLLGKKTGRGFYNYQEA